MRSVIIVWVIGCIVAFARGVTRTPTTTQTAPSDDSR
jgi:hypothetical protein